MNCCVPVAPPPLRPLALHELSWRVSALPLDRAAGRVPESDQDNTTTKKDWLSVKLLMNQIQNSKGTSGLDTLERGVKRGKPWQPKPEHKEQRWLA